MNAQDWLAVYAALLSSVLAVIQIARFLESRQRIHFRVAYSTLVSGAPGTSSLPLISINIGNWAPTPIHLASVGLLYRDGSGLLFNQVAELWHSQRLPAKIEPHDGFVMGVLPSRLAETLKGPDGVDRLSRVMCTDGSGRTYARRLSKHEREDMKKAITDQLATSSEA